MRIVPRTYRLGGLLWLRVLWAALVIFTLSGIYPVQAAPSVEPEDRVAVLNYSNNHITLESARAFPVLNILSNVDTTEAITLVWEQSPTGLYQTTPMIAFMTNELWFDGISSSAWTGLRVWKPGGRGIEYKPLITIGLSAPDVAPTTVRIEADDQYYLQVTLTSGTVLRDLVQPGGNDWDARFWREFLLEWGYDARWASLTIVNRHPDWIECSDGVFRRTRTRAFFPVITRHASQ